MAVVVQQIINGLAAGGIYALIAIGWTTVFGIVGIINWTHGEVYMIGAYTGFFLTTMGRMTLIPALLISMCVGAGAAMLLDQFGYVPLRKRGLSSSPASSPPLVFPRWSGILPMRRSRRIPECIRSSWSISS